METFFALLALCAGKSPVPVNSAHKSQWRGALMFIFYLHLNKRLRKQSWGWWFETHSSLLWRHCNECFNVSMSLGSEATPTTTQLLNSRCILNRNQHTALMDDISINIITPVCNTSTIRHCLAFAYISFTASQFVFSPAHSLICNTQRQNTWYHIDITQHISTNHITRQIVMLSVTSALTQ